jgi:hypothetical protein
MTDIPNLLYAHNIESNIYPIDKIRNIIVMNIIFLSFGVKQLHISVIDTFLSGSRQSISGIYYFY